MNELENAPTPLPFVVLEFAVVGEEVVLLQHIPREVIAAPPSLVTFPPPEAVVCVMDEIDVVVIPTGIVAAIVVNVFTSP